MLDKIRITLLINAIEWAIKKYNSLTPEQQEQIQELIKKIADMILSKKSE